MSGNASNPLHEGELQEKTHEKVKEPDMYRCVLHNDHYTTMEFVVEVIMKVFRKPVAEATQIMLRVHRRGSGTAGVYTYDIAKTKANQVRKLAREREYPLKCTVEKT
jgi:ATP-dependent Clp protease adaptor protein ClpS